TSDGKEVEGIVCSANFWDRVFMLVQIIEPLYEVLRVVDGDRRPTIGLVYAKNEAAKKIREVSPRYAHLVLDVVEDRWDRQMSRDLHMAAYYLHPAYHYAMELSYDDDLTAAFTRVVERLSRSALDAANAIDQMKSFRERVGSFAEPSAIAGGANLDDDVNFERLMLGLAARSQFMREAPAIASSQSRRKGSHTQSAAPSQAAKGKAVATIELAKGKGKTKVKHVAQPKALSYESHLPQHKKRRVGFPGGPRKGKKWLPLLKIYLILQI
ncbi:hypothetical protein Taro_011078, partial [Colocasia esculenta]|nr:hypothetical protein [Colocasia esculenta]